MDKDITGNFNNINLQKYGATKANITSAQSSCVNIPESVQLEQEAMQKEESLLQLKENIKEAEDVEEARKTLIESGILTEEEKQEAEKMSKEEFLQAVRVLGQKE